MKTKLKALLAKINPAVRATASKAGVAAAHTLSAGVIGVFVADQAGVRISVSALTALALAAFAAAGSVVLSTVGQDLTDLAKGLLAKATKKS